MAPLVLLFTTFGIPPLQRAQEARVLETAREMVDGGGGWRAWMVPHLNGRVRLQKPPLAYWLSASSFKAFGISIWAGRLPMVVAAAGTLAVTYLLGRWLFNDDVATIAWSTICGCLLFCRLGQHAETDILATFFVTTAVSALWRAWAAMHPKSPTEPGKRSDFWWHHLAAASIAMAVLAKGAPAIFPPLFLLGVTLLQGGWRVWWRFCVTGGVLTLTALALPWFVYVANVPGSKVLASELSVVAGGGGHANPPWFYLPHVFTQTSPWEGFLALALVAAATHARRDMRVRGLVIWLLAIIVPLSLIGQKQAHYLMFALPPLALLVGWAVARAVSGADKPLLRGFRWVVIGMLVIASVAVPAPFVAGLALRGRIIPFDFVLSAIFAALVATGWWVHARRGAAASIAVMSAISTIMMTLGISAWAPTLQQTTYVRLVRDLQATFGDRPYAFYETESLPLVFHLRRLIGEVPKKDVDQALARDPRLVVLVVGATEATRHRLASLDRAFSVVIDKRNVDVYQLPAADGRTSDTP